MRGCADARCDATNEDEHRSARHRRSVFAVPGETAPTPASILWVRPRDAVREVKVMGTDNLCRECRVTFADDSYICLLTPGTSPVDLAKALGSR
jgi:hypothetical protein